MADLISREALQSVLDGIVRNYIADKSFQCNVAAGVVCDIQDTVIAEMPAVDAEPVKHGRWVKDHDGDEYCENCYRYMPDREVTGDPCATNYCPNCGAKMDLEEERCVKD